ncbi:hypothetical protein EVAR_12041_1 [Eumeta japonica]|uniref:Serpin domain-containing protein n=1 Tax=Eumeta variegata TaxID=151549 RepID=A0A4C1U5A7_EUMVA|nr:hypothetical protein EVAR_12041_1 [Eumeta japonica]
MRTAMRRNVIVNIFNKHFIHTISTGFSRGSSGRLEIFDLLIKLYFFGFPKGPYCVCPSRSNVVPLRRITLERGVSVVEIPYATPGLTLVVAIPRCGCGLATLATHLGVLGDGIPARRLLRRLSPRRVAITMPLYTLRMTLLLPNKLQYMGISRLVKDSKERASPGTTGGNAGGFEISLAVQTIVFGNEAGRNAFKDDGIEWDEKPELELVVNRPYAFFVRWRDVTLLNGHFVL